jgi:23S rRNA (guanosine2251-2'-O)-methyltransferase
MSELLYGRQAVREALRAGRRRLHRLLLSTGVQESGPIAEILTRAQQLRLPVERVERQQLDRRVRDANHQGVLLEADEYPYVALQDCLDLATSRRQPALLLLLDHLQDPQNIGTLLRSADAFGVHGIVIPSRRAAEITPAVVNASSGATEHLNITIVGNLAQTIVELQQLGLWAVGIEDDERAQPLAGTDLNLPLALVLGAEGSGMSRLVRERCDFLVRLPMTGSISSLNAATAGSIVLYQARRLPAAG